MSEQINFKHMEITTDDFSVILQKHPIVTVDIFPNREDKIITRNGRVYDTKALADQIKEYCNDNKNNVKLEEQLKEISDKSKSNKNSYEIDSRLTLPRNFLLMKEDTHNQFDQFINFASTHEINNERSVKKLLGADYSLDYSLEPDYSGNTLVAFSVVKSRGVKYGDITT